MFYVKNLQTYRLIPMEFPEDVLSVISAFARPRRPKQREANLIKEHVKETRDKVVQKLQLMAKHDPFRNQTYQRTISMVENWTHYGRVKIARRPPGWLRLPLGPTPKYDTPIYLTLYRRSL